MRPFGRKLFDGDDRGDYDCHLSKRGPARGGVTEPLHQERMPDGGIDESNNAASRKFQRRRFVIACAGRSTISSRCF